jgi:hypothetical protein
MKSTLLLPPSLILLVTSSLVEGGVGTGWTVVTWLDMQFKNRVRCEKLFNKKNTTHDNQMIQYLISYVTMFFSRIQFAWIYNYPSETEINEINEINHKFRWINIHKYTKSENEDNLKEWLVGFIDGVGSFTVNINIKTLKFYFIFKLSQKHNNLQVLHFIKKFLGVGKIRKDKEGMYHYIINDIIIIKKIIIPMIEKFNLLTNKEYNYQQFLNCIEISDNSNLTLDIKIKLMNEILIKAKPEKYESIVWSIKQSPKIENWLIGFVETEGKFLIYKNEEGNYIHIFKLSLMKDDIVLKAIKNHLNLNCDIIINKSGYYNLEVKDKISLKRIKLYFFKTMKGIKSLEYRIWARSFRYKGNNKKLIKIQSLLESINISD